MNTYKIIAAVIACSITSVLIPAAGFGQEEASVVTAKRQDVPTRHVGYKDLNLATDDGVATLRRRVKHAAIDVCGDKDAQLMYSLFAQSRCYHGAMNGAEPQIATAVKRYRSNDVAAARFDTIVVASRR